MKKYKSITINKKRYYLYKIEWVDIFGDAGHRSFDALENMKPASKTTFAFLFKRSKKFIHTFSTYDQNDEEFSDCNVFPIGVIVSMNKIDI
tara:strand:- start:3366 stop:3638 length:273 start_codon:yes stop_codon:yes gene_type:complete